MCRLNVTLQPNELLFVNVNKELSLFARAVYVLSLV